MFVLTVGLIVPSLSWNGKMCKKTERIWITRERARSGAWKTWKANHISQAAVQLNPGKLVCEAAGIKRNPSLLALA
jgi:hypothetical protein